MKAVPPKLRFLSPLLWAPIILAGFAVLYWFNPATYEFYPRCQFHLLTGWNCPGCGLTRALHALLHADLATAIRDNALFILTLVTLLVRGAWFGLNQFLHRPNGEFFPVKFLWWLLAAAVVFAVVRNLPVGAFLSP